MRRLTHTASTAFHTATAAPRRRTTHRRGRLAALLASLSLGLAACGGGGDSTEPTTDDDSSADAETTAYAVDGTANPSDASATVDSALAAAEASSQLIMTSAAAAGRQHALAVALPASSPTDPDSAETETACPGGGTVTQVVTGTVASVANPLPDSGETYDYRFTACSLAGIGRLDGSMQLKFVTVSDDADTGDTVRAGEWKLDTLTLVPQSTTPRGLTATATVTGAGGFARSVVNAGDNQTATTQLTANSLVLSVVGSKRSAGASLSLMDITRVASFNAGVMQSGQIKGTVTVKPDRAGGQSITTDLSGGMTFDANGQPSSGSWSIHRPQLIVGITAASGTATITLDKGADGVVDRTLTLPLSSLTSGSAI